MLRVTAKNKMTEKVRELIDEVVWSPDDSVDKNVGSQLDKIINDHVVPMVLPALALKNLHQWAEEQSKIHNDKTSKLGTTITQIILSGADCKSVANLRDHHWRISTRYAKAAIRIWTWWKTY